MVIVGEKKLNFTYNNKVYHVGEKIKVTESCARFVKAKTPIVTIMGITKDNIYIKVNEPYSDSRREYALQINNINDWLVDNITNSNVNIISIPKPLNQITLKTVYAKPEKYNNNNLLYIVIAALSLVSLLIFRGGIIFAAIGIWILKIIVEADKEERKHIIYSYEDEKSK